MFGTKLGECPPDMQELGPEVWSPQGVKILGTPVGHAEFVQAAMNARLEEEDKLWRALSWVPDLQCAWQLLVQCAGPRCHHLLRTMPPSQVVGYAAGHDEGMRQAMVSLLGELPGDGEQQSAAHRIASLPMRLGGLGIRSAARMSPAAHWASWADALPMLQARLPHVTAHIVGGLDGEAPLTGCLGELQESARLLDHSGFVGRPEWNALRDGARPHEFVAEPGEWQHGWQYFASSSFESHFRETVVLAQSSAANQAHLRSGTQQRSLWLPHCTRISDPANVVQDDCVGAARSSTSDHRSRVRVRRWVGSMRAPPGSMSSLREVAI